MKSKFLEDFKKFAMRGNVVDMAVGIIIGGAFGKIVSSLVADVIMPPIGLLIGGVNFTDLKITLEKAVLSPGGEVVKPAVSINYGNFLQTTLDFLIISFSIFLLIRLLSKLQEKKKEEAPAPAAPPADVQLLTEIRDLLQNKQDKSQRGEHPRNQYPCLAMRSSLGFKTAKRETERPDISHIHSNQHKPE